jgi:hypothetical protein
MQTEKRKRGASGGLDCGEAVTIFFPGIFLSCAAHARHGVMRHLTSRGKRSLLDIEHQTNDAAICRHQMSPMAEKSRHDSWYVCGRTE